MGQLAAIVYAVLLWWFSTGLILLLNHLPARSFRYSMAGASLLLVLSLAGMRVSAGESTVPAAYAAFTCAVIAWGWQEMAFFMGYLTGPRRAAGPAVRGWRHFWHACQTCLHHEAAIALTAALILAVTAAGPDRVAPLTYAALWVMRLSAKLNVFLGVRNLNEQFIPRRLAYLTAYMRVRRCNGLLPVSIAGGTAASVLVARAPAATPGLAVGHVLVATLLALAVVEHAVMVLPLPFDALWRGFRRCPAEPARRRADPIILAPAGALDRR